MAIMEDIFRPTTNWYSASTSDAINHDSYFEMRRWLDEYTVGQYFIVSIKDIRFKLHEDAVMFTLRWG